MQRYWSVVAVPVLLAGLFLLQTPLVSASENNDNLALLYAKVENLENSLKALNGRLSNLQASLDSLGSALNDLRNRLSVLQSGAKQLMAYAMVISGGQYSIHPITGLMAENFTVPPGSVLVLVAMTESGTMCDGTVKLTPPLFSSASQGTLLPWMLMGGGMSTFSYSLPMSNGFCMVPVPSGMEGMWMARIEPNVAGYAPVTFFFNVSSAQKPQSVSYYLTTIGEFAKGKACVIKGTDQTGAVVEGTVRVKDAKTGMVLSEGPNPLTFVPTSDSVIASLVCNGKEVATSYFSEYRPPTGHGGGINWSVVAVPLAIVVMVLAYVFLLRGGRRIKIPR